MTMAQATLFKAACAAAMLAATPVFAQGNNPAGQTGAGAASTAPPAHEATPGSAMTGHMHHSAMGEHHAKAHGSADFLGCGRGSPERRELPGRPEG